MLRMEATFKASRGMLWTIERKTGVNNHGDPKDNCRWPGV